MRKNIALLFTLMLPLFFFNACSSSDDNGGGTEPDKEQVIATSNFTLNTPHQWNISKQTETFFIINNKAEMEKYLVPTIRTTYGIPDPVITPDFEKYTLILASGPTQNGVDKVETRLIRHNSVDYTFEINVSTNATNVTEGYMVAVTVPRLANNEKVIKNAIIK